MAYVHIDAHPAMPNLSLVYWVYSPYALNANNKIPTTNITEDIITYFLGFIIGSDSSFNLFLLHTL